MTNFLIIFNFVCFVYPQTCATRHSSIIQFLNIFIRLKETPESLTSISHFPLSIWRRLLLFLWLNLHILDLPYEWNHAIYILGVWFLFLNIKISRYICVGSMQQELIHFWDWIIFYYRYILFMHLFTKTLLGWYLFKFLLLALLGIYVGQGSHMFSITNTLALII